MDSRFEACAAVLPQLKVALCCLYRTPDDDNFESFIDSLSDLLGEMTEHKGSFIIMGDFNVHLEDDLNNRQIYQKGIFCSTIESYGFKYTIQDYTRIPTNGKPSCIDNFLTNFHNDWFSSRVGGIILSDHTSQEFHIGKEKVQPQSRISRARVLRPEGICSVRGALGGTSWSGVYGVRDADLATSRFIDILTQVLDSCCPWKTRKTKTTTRKNHWFHDGLLLLRDEYYDLRNWSRETGDPNIKARANAARGVYKEAVNEAKKNFNSNRIAASTNVARTSWQVVREELGTRSVSRPGLSGDFSPCPDGFNDAFAAVFWSDIGGNVQSANPRHFLTAAPAPLELFTLEDVGVEEVFLVMRNLKNSRANDIFGLTSSLIKEIADLIDEPLTYIVNLSFESGVFPSILKTAKITPIPKKGKMGSYSDFRPVCILPVLAKIFEGLLLRRISKFFEINNLLHENQYGFRKGVSTTSAAIHLLRSVLKGIEERYKVALSLFDLSKAFDLVPHDILLQKLEYYGFDERSTIFIRDYLEGWVQVVEYEGELSSPARITRGVKQGSVLGPVLFIIFINDLLHYLEDATISAFLFADDITILSKAAGENEQRRNTELAATLVTDWCSSNGLRLNTDKTQNLTIDLAAPLTDSVNFLGVSIDNRLSWKSHISELAKQLARCNFMLRRLSFSTSHEVLRMVYFACFFSRMAYCILVWGSSPHWESIFRMQKTAVRIVCGLDHRVSCRGHFRRVGTLTLPSLYVLTMLVYVKSQLHLHPTRSEVHNYNTRGRNGLYITHCRLSKTQGTDPYQIGARLYNLLPSRIRQLTGRQFKRALKQVLMERELYSVQDYWQLDFSRT